MDTLSLVVLLGFGAYLLAKYGTGNGLLSPFTIPGTTAPPTSTGGGLLDALANAIARQEGYNVPGSVAQRNNNPGNIGGPTQSFATPEAGWSQLYHQLQIIFDGTSTVYDPSMTISEMGMKYSNQDPNWGNNVASILGVSPDTTLSDLQSLYGGL